jgi:glycosyltransferase involved in cell wall biosynthesis
MPLIISEAQAMGKPVVVTDVGNNREVLQATGGGVVVDQIGDIHALANGVRQMILNPPDAEKIRRAIIENYSIEIGAEQYYHVFLGQTPTGTSFA